MDRITEIYDAILTLGEETQLPAPICHWYAQLCATFDRHPADPPIEAPAKWADDPEFVKFKTEYPKRQGGENWKQTYKSWLRARKGHTVVAIIDGARRYREYMEAEGKVDTEFVQMATTFLNQENWLKAWDVKAREFIKKPRIPMGEGPSLPPSAGELLKRRQQRGLFDPQGSK